MNVTGLKPEQIPIKMVSFEALLHPNVMPYANVRGAPDMHMERAPYSKIAWLPGREWLRLRVGEA